MDYEFRIKLAERDLAHLQEMQQIARERQDTSDARLEQIQGLLLETMETVKRIADQTEILTAAQQLTQKTLQELIAALLREHPNGGGTH